MAFQNIKGQERAVGTLREYLKAKKIAGAYLFSGPEGVGKYFLARTFAKAVNCLLGQDEPCDTCASCAKVDKNEHPDVHIIDRADGESISIESIRELKKSISLKPYEGRFKVFIINDAHKLGAEAANALLKVLEEPPGDSLIILVSAKSAKLFKTVISRCRTVKFFPLKRAELSTILKKDYFLDGGLAHFLAYSSEGRIGRSLNLKDTDALKQKNKVIDAFLEPRAEPLDALANQSRQDIRLYLNLLAGWFRDIYLIKAGAPQDELINLDRRDEILKLMNRYSRPELDEIFRLISDSLLNLEQNVNVKLLLSNLKVQIWKEKF
jgi:DNA polymerase-3 subunit delta'